VTLPSDARRLVEQVLAAARLPPRERDRVRSELEGHFQDGLDQRVPLADLIASFGEPRAVAALIRRVARRNRRWPVLGHACVASIAILSAAYGIAFLRLASFPVTASHGGLDAELDSVAGAIAAAEHALRNSSGIEASFDVARGLTAASSLWKRSAGVLLLETTLRAGDSVMSVGEQRQLLGRVEGSLRFPVAEAEAVAEAERSLLARLAGTQGRMDQRRLQVLRLAKGIMHTRLSARLLEPIYFSHRMDAAHLQALAEHLVRARVAAAERARQALLLRWISLNDVATS
jgi:hypothetical protein